MLCVAPGSPYSSYTSCLVCAPAFQQHYLCSSEIKIINVKSGKHWIKMCSKPSWLVWMYIWNTPWGQKIRLIGIHILEMQAVLGNSAQKNGTDKVQLRSNHTFLVSMTGATFKQNLVIKWLNEVWSPRCNGSWATARTYAYTVLFNWCSHTPYGDISDRSEAYIRELQIRSKRRITWLLLWAFCKARRAQSRD